jgi:hypothetical protein
VSKGRRGGASRPPSPGRQRSTHATQLGLELDGGGGLALERDVRL